jgi:hypothetical protein
MRKDSQILSGIFSKLITKDHDIFTNSFTFGRKSQETSMNIAFKRNGLTLHSSQNGRRRAMRSCVALIAFQTLSIILVTQ